MSKNVKKSTQIVREKCLFLQYGVSHGRLYCFCCGDNLVNTVPCCLYQHELVQLIAGQMAPTVRGVQPKCVNYLFIRSFIILLLAWCPEWKWRL